MTAFFASFGLIFLAELGDKSMLLVVTLAARYRWWVVWTALVLSAALLMALAVLVGEAAGRLLPDEVIAIAAAALFIGFGVFTLVSGDEEERSVEARARSEWMVAPLLTGAFVLAELGDKTQIAALSLAGLNPTARLAVWGGATAGMVGADTLALAVGGALARVASPRVLRRAAGVIFVLFGAVTLTTIVI